MHNETVKTKFVHNKWKRLMLKTNMDKYDNKFDIPKTVCYTRHLLLLPKILIHLVLHNKGQQQNFEIS